MSFPNMKYELIFGTSLPKREGIIWFENQTGFTRIGGFGTTITKYMEDIRNSSKSWFILNGSCTCRDSLLYDLTNAFLEVYNVASRMGRTQYYISYSLLIKIPKETGAWLDKWIAKYAQCSNHLQIIHTGDCTYVKLENEFQNLTAKVSMVLFLINRSEYFTDQMLADPKQFIHTVLTMPGNMFPNDYDSKIEYSIFQGFAIYGISIYSLSLNYNTPDFNLGIARRAMNLANLNEVYFLEYLRIMDIDPKLVDDYSNYNAGIPWVSLYYLMYPNNKGKKFKYDINCNYIDPKDYNYDDDEDEYEEDEEESYGESEEDE